VLGAEPMLRAGLEPTYRSTYRWIEAQVMRDVIPETRVSCAQIFQSNLTRDGEACCRRALAGSRQHVNASLFQRKSLRVKSTASRSLASRTGMCGATRNDQPTIVIGLCWRRLNVNNDRVLEVDESEPVAELHAVVKPGCPR
jgi:hypothetical protein